MKRSAIFGLSIVALAAVTATDAAAQRPVRILDAVYSGPMLCEKLPFTDFAAQETMTVTIAGAKSAYKHVVRLGRKPEPGDETGTARVDGTKLILRGAWKGEAGQYAASYEGSFVRRRFKLIGTQTWTHQGRIVTRKCSGVVERPLRAFLPRNKKAAE